MAAGVVVHAAKVPNDDAGVAVVASLYKSLLICWHDAKVKLPTVVAKSAAVAAPMPGSLTSCV